MGADILGLGIPWGTSLPGVYPLRNIPQGISPRGYSLGIFPGRYPPGKIPQRYFPGGISPRDMLWRHPWWISPAGYSRRICLGVPVVIPESPHEQDERFSCCPRGPHHPLTPVDSEMVCFIGDVIPSIPLGTSWDSNVRTQSLELVHCLSRCVSVLLQTTSGKSKISILEDVAYPHSNEG